MKLKEAARKVEDGVEETLTYCEFPFEHWRGVVASIRVESLSAMKSADIPNLAQNNGTEPVADAVHSSEHFILRDSLGNVLHLADSLISYVLQRSQEVNTRKATSM